MTDQVLIIGGGLAGVEAALECARAGAQVLILERSPVAGGRLAAPLSEEKGAEGGLPALQALADNDRIRLVTQAELVSVAGRPGSFTVKFRRQERFVSDACTRCNLCRAACPVVVPNEWDAGLTYRKAIYTPLASTLPEAYVIDLSHCLNQPPNYLPCRRCAEVCEDDAISFEFPLQTEEEVQVASLVLAAGVDIGDANGLEDLGYGAHPDILTSAELQRMLETPGPSGGFAVRPSSEDYPASILLVVNALEPFGLYVLASQVHQLVEQGVDEIHVLVPSLPELGASLDDVPGLVLHQGGMFRSAGGDDGGVRTSWEDFSDRRLVSRDYDLVVLATSVVPPSGLGELAALLGMGLGDDGYVDGNLPQPDGVYAAGCVTGPKSVADTRRDALRAAELALADVNPRLLDPQYLERKGIELEPESGVDRPQDDIRGRIEQMLYGLLQQS
ncbi:MAG: FAD-dependent oxidoreductase [Xanthomonadales bacterium]|nr:FAD-dependent oxidoreductase [Xanthomonadales bacterium]